MRLPRPSAAAGFTLVETLIACTMAAVLMTLAVPAFRGHDLRAGRLDAVEALTRVQQAQEKFRSAHGLYAGDLGGLMGTNGRSPQGRYAIAVAPSGPMSYVATATAQGPQARDPGCERLTLVVNEGFATLGPNAGCWLR
jgi:type IV pilus assembly protein PilE